VTCTVLHGGKIQETREANLEGFKDGTYDVLVATDVVGRGIDISGVQQVINYEMPSDIEKYQHRIGRTGRAGKTGIATSFLTEADTQIFFDLKNMLTASNMVHYRSSSPSHCVPSFHLSNLFGVHLNRKFLMSWPTTKHPKPNQVIRTHANQSQPFNTPNDRLLCICYMLFQLVTSYYTPCNLRCRLLVSVLSLLKIISSRV
jgi:hypothetical protein